MCRSRSPTSPDSSLGQCVLRRTARDPANTFRRVLPSLTDERIMSGKSELINDGEEEGAGDRSSYRSMEFVWGTCDAAPRSASWCEAPAFDPAKVAAVCGVEYHVETAKETTGETDTARTGLRPVGGVVPAALEPPRLIEDDEPPTETETSEAETSAPAPAVVVPVATANGAAGRTKKDIFGTGGAESPAAFVPAGAWAETAEVTADLNAVGASRAVAHLVLRDGDQFFAGENLPWARLEVNGRVVRVPHDVKHGDVVRLAVRAESAAEIEAWTAEDERAKTASALGGDSSVDSSGTQIPVLSSRGDPVRSATLKLGSYEGVLRARVADRATRVAMYRQALRGATTLEADVTASEEKETKAEEETKVPKEETKVPKEETKVLKEETKVPKEATKVPKEATKPPAESTRARIEDEDDQETAAAKVDAAIPVDAADPGAGPEKTQGPKPGRMSLIAPTTDAHADASLGTGLNDDDDAPPEEIVSPAGVVHVRAPQPNQWVLIPPPDQDPIVVTGVGEGSTAAVTVKLLHEIEAHGQGTLYATLGDEPLGLSNDGREPPRGNANGVFVKVNSEDRSVKGGTVKVWTRHGIMEVPRPGVRETKVEVVDGDRIRLKIRSPGFADPPPGGDKSDKRPISGRYRVAVFVGDEWVGTAAVTTATSREEERAANAAFEGSIRRARARANAAAAMGSEAVHPAERSDGVSSSEIPSDVARPTTTSIDSSGGPVTPRVLNPPPKATTRVSLISGRPVLVDEMERAPRGVTRVVAANEWNMLPSRGFMRVAGVLPSAELRLTVHAYETKAGDVWLRRAAMDANAAEATAAMGERDLSIGGNDEWIHAQLGAAPEEVANANATRADTDDDAGLPDWVEVRVEGQVVTPPVPVWLSRRISLRVRASPDDMVARRVVVRAGTQSWEATVISEDASIAIPDKVEPSSGMDKAVVDEEKAPMGTVSVRAVASPRDVVVLPRTAAPPEDSADRSNGLTVDPTTGNLVGTYVPSLREAHGDGDGFGVPVSGLGDGVTCEVTMLADEGVDAEARAKRWLGAGSRSSASLGESSGGESSGVVPGWAALLVNGEQKTLPYAARDGDTLGAVIAAPGSAGGVRVVVLACPHDVATDGEKTVTDYAAALVASVVVKKDDEGASSGDSSSAPISPSPTQSSNLGEVDKDGDDRIRSRDLLVGSVGVRMCNPNELQRRERADKLVYDRTNSMTYSDEFPNVCGARPACLGDGDAAKRGRDVVFVVDASDAVGRALFDEHVLESLKTMFCASHEGTQSQASVILYPAPRNVKTCGSHEVAVPLGRYSAREWFDKIDELREDDESCCGFRHTENIGDSPGLGDSPGAPARLPTGSAPLAEALDAAAAELDARGAHAPSNALVVVVAAAVPSPVVKSESCSEDAPAKFTSMTRDWPFAKFKSSPGAKDNDDDGEDVTACTYLWRHVPDAARRLRATGARIAGVHLAGLDEGGLASASAGLGAHLVGAPWPGACDADGFCSIQAQYGGELGRWLYGGSNANGHDGSGHRGEDAFAQEDSPEHFVYDAGEYKTCEAVIRAGAGGQRERSIVSFPHGAHVRTLHASNLRSASSTGPDAGENGLARAVAPLMCESASSTDPAEMAVSSFGKKSDRSSRLGTRKEGVGGGVTTNDEGATLLDSDDRICATEADALGIEPVISRCAGGDEDATVACLDSLVYAACAAVERAPSAVVASETAPETAESGREPTVASGCYDDGAVRLVGSERHATLASVACDRVCRTRSADSPVAGSNPSGVAGGAPFRETRARRVEIEVRCEGEGRCRAGAVRWFAAGREADGRRAELTD